MTSDRPMHESHDCGGDAAAYVLGALEPVEVDAFREHMAGCVVCRDEVAALQQVADALPMAAPPQAAPRSLRRRVLREARAEPRSPPAARARPRRPARALPRPALAGASLLAAALVIGGGVELATSGGSSGTRVIQASVSGSPASAQLRVTGGHAELVVRRLPPPPAGRIYEIWTARAHGAPSPTKTLFSVTGAGAGDVGVPGSVRGVRLVMVTQEPAGGSLAPTSPPVIVAHLT
jgi:anti-sigma-K factor RskA